MSLIVRLCVIGFIALGIFMSCDTPPDPWNVSHPEVGWYNSEPCSAEEPDSETTIDTGVDQETDTDTATEIETETEETEPPLDTETETATNQPVKKSCRESVTCLFQNAKNPMSCLTQADPEAQKLLLDVITCLVSKGCLKDLQNIQSLVTCAMSQCGAEFLACMADS